MKKGIGLIYIILHTSVLSAQIGQYKFFAGGGLGFSYDGFGEQKITLANGANTTRTLKPAINWNIAPTMAYFINEKLACGIAINMGSTFIAQRKSLDENAVENINAFNYGGRLYVRHYIEIWRSIYFHSQFNLDFNASTYNDKYAVNQSQLLDSIKVTQGSFEASINPGITFFLIPKLAFDFSFNKVLSYNFTRTNIEPLASKTPRLENTTGGFSIGLNLVPTIGLYYYFSKY